MQLTVIARRFNYRNQSVASRPERQRVGGGGVQFAEVDVGFRGTFVTHVERDPRPVEMTPLQLRADGRAGPGEAAATADLAKSSKGELRWASTKTTGDQDRGHLAVTL